MQIFRRVPVEAAELDVALFFMAGRPQHTIAEFALSYATDAEPSLSGNWKLLGVQRFNAEVTIRMQLSDGVLHLIIEDNGRGFDDS